MRRFVLVGLMVVLVAAAAVGGPARGDDASSIVDYEVVINRGLTSAVVGQPVPVVATGPAVSPVGAAWVMACGYSAGWAFQCDQVGTVETEFDGRFEGWIDMPEMVEGPDATIDCRVGVACLIVFLVVDRESIRGGGVAAVTAVQASDAD